jgi:acetyl-CoA carboxylase biotin carboxyl carrier protein
MPANNRGGKRLDAKEIKEILRILEEQDIVEFELEQDGMKLRICRASRTASPLPAPSPVAFAASSSVAAPALAAATGPVAVPSAAPEAASNEVVAKSPIVGTFYRAPDPNSPPFVSVGDRVRVGQVLCIIEAMKLMNEIEAEVAGEVLQIHAEAGQPVQYGDPLFTIRPA